RRERASKKRQTASRWLSVFCVATTPTPIFILQLDNSTLRLNKKEASFRKTLNEAFFLPAKRGKDFLTSQSVF
ncbi:MAG: hypothetical protein K6E78_04420, partial [Treponema sp.]|nr:hypothetical protein [Treponema sp.]